MHQKDDRHEHHRPRRVDQRDQLAAGNELANVEEILLCFAAGFLGMGGGAVAQ